MAALEPRPNVLNLTDPPTVRIRVGEPVRLVGRSLEADTKRIMAAIVELLPADAYRRRTPTPEELAATYPPGYSGNPERESERRPGTDWNLFVRNSHPDPRRRRRPVTPHDAA